MPRTLKVCFGSFSDFISHENALTKKHPLTILFGVSRKNKEVKEYMKQQNSFIWGLGIVLWQFISLSFALTWFRSLAKIKSLKTQLIASLSVIPSVINNIYLKLHLGIWALTHPLKSSFSLVCLGSPCRAAPLVFDVSCKWELLQPWDTAQPVCTEHFNTLQLLHQPV